MTEPAVQTGVDDVHVHPRHTGQRWLDMALALAAITISVISLFVAIEHGRTERQLVAASTWPFPIFEQDTLGLEIGSRLASLQVQNSGVGPARILSARVLLDGHPMHGRAELLTRCCGPFQGDTAAQIALGLESENPITGVLAARAGVTFLALRETRVNASLWNNLNAARTRLSFDVCYCSVLDECWRTDLRVTSHPVRVDQCSPGPDDYAE